MSNKFSNPSQFEAAVQYLTWRLLTLQGRAGRTSATVIPAATLDAAIMPDSGRIVGFSMKALEVGTTSSATFNTVGLYRALKGSVTLTQIAKLSTNRGLNGAETSVQLTGATQLVSPGDLLAIRRLTKLNTGSQLFVSVSV